VTGAWFAEMFARQKRLDPLERTLRKYAPTETAERSIEEKVENARAFFRACSQANANAGASNV
jgi:hypothetical protein